MITFAMDGKLHDGKIARSVGRIAVIEGVGSDAGSYFCKGPGGTSRHGSLGEAQIAAAWLANDSDPSAPLAFELGRTAARDDKTYADNPFTKGSDEYREWNRGIDAARNGKVGGAQYAAASDARQDTRAPGSGPTLNLTNTKYGQGEKTGKIVSKDGRWGYRKSNDSVWYGPYSSASEAAAAAMKNGVTVDSAEMATDPSVSPAQHRAMGAAAGGHSTLGIPKKVGKEFVKADKGKGYDAKPRAIGQHVKILGGMKEFVGQSGTIISKEGSHYRVRLDEPIDIPGVGKVKDDLWEGDLLKAMDRMPAADEIYDGASDEPIGWIIAAPGAPSTIFKSKEEKERAEAQWRQSNPHQKTDKWPQNRNQGYTDPGHSEWA